jgi:hypothetical protein
MQTGENGRELGMAAGQNWGRKLGTEGEKNWGLNWGNCFFQRLRGILALLAMAFDHAHQIRQMEGLAQQNEACL